MSGEDRLKVVHATRWLFRTLFHRSNRRLDARPRSTSQERNTNRSPVGSQAIGSGGEGAQSNLQECFSETLTLAEAEVLALTTLKQVMEDRLTDENIDV